MLYLRYLDRPLAAVIIAVLVALASPAAAVEADSGVITLRLEDTEQDGAGRTPTDPAVALPEAPPKPWTQPSVIEVPPCKGFCAPPPDIKAVSAVLMDPVSGQVVYSKNAHVRRPNASTTKIMTAILLIENCGMSETITASKNAAKTPYTSIHLMPGEKISAKDLLMALMIRSANDAAVAIAEHVGGSTTKFAAMMNAKAKEIGCKNTNFVTPNGLHADNHYSTAYDLCLMARHAMRYPIFDEATNTRKHTLSSRTMNKKDLVVISRHKFMKDYIGADGVKSGYVKQAGYCYVGSATRDGWRLLSAVLKSDNSGRDTGIVMDYVFSNFRPVNVASANVAVVGAEVVGGDRKMVAAAPVKDLRVIVPRTGARIVTKLNMEPLEAPVVRGARVGTISAELDGRVIDSVDLRAVEDVGISMARRIMSWAKTSGLFVLCVVAGGRFGTAIAKGARRRRARVTTAIRSYNRFR